jgi:prepilin-type N-terminal cleavage/methylation domain-containing protein
MHCSRDERGVTLIELMVSLALTAMVVGAVVTLWAQSQQAYMQGTEAADTQQRVRLAMDQLVRAIQQTGANPRNQAFAGALNNDAAFVAFREVGPTCLRLYSDLDGDGNVLGAQENLSIDWAGGGQPVKIESGGGPDNGLPFVAPPAGQLELAENIVPNPGNIPMFQYFTGPNDVNPNVQLVLPAGIIPCGNTMVEADRRRIGRVLITLTAEGRVGNEIVKRTLVSEARPRNVP